MPSRLLKYKGWWSTRLRLTIWSTLLVWSAVLAALLGVREGLRYSLFDEFDSTLAGEVDEVIAVIRDLYPERDGILAEMKRKADSHKSRGWYIRWVEPDHLGTVWQTDNAPALPLKKRVYQTSEFSVWASVSHRSVEKVIDLPNVPRYFVRMGASIDYVQSDVERLTSVLAPVGIALCLLAPLGGSWIAARAMSPVQTIIETTERLRPQHLSERLKSRGVGDELDQLAEKINQFLDQIAAHVRRNHDFLANAAHELRSPLAAILSSVEVALEKSRSAEDYQELLFSIHDECRHLANLVNQLMELAERDARGREITHEPVPLAEVAHNAMEMFDAVAEDRGVTLKGDLDAACVLPGDRKQLRQLVTNLLDNAIKFTPPHGVVTVTVKFAPEKEVVIFRVADTGIGIPQQDLPRVFERFYQADKSRQRTEARGNGLGLSICHAIVTAHGGVITVDSHQGVGTTFTVKLPVSPAVALEPESVSASY